MRYDSRDPACPRGLFVLAATGQPLRWVVWAEIPDDPALEATFEAFREEPNAALVRGVWPAAIRYQSRARLRFVPAAPVHGKPSDPRDLAGSLDEARRRVDRRLLVLSEECSAPHCHALATWAVAWEQILEPERGADGLLYERAVTTRRLAYCERHYKPPRQVSLRGVESEVEVEARPQW